MSFADSFQFFLYLTTRYVSPEAVAAEWVLTVFAAVAVLFVLSRLPLSGVARAFHRLAANRRLAVTLCLILPIACRVSLLGIMPVPDPSIHDEFSHLLLGDTLAHGRLANPSHPLWKHFESIHILQQPTYASMYPPAQGAFLALGQVVFGHPWAGVLFSVGLMCGLLCWMFQGWFSEEWSLFGTLVVILKICLTGLWINSYLGASPSAIGAALVLGSAGRRKYPLLFGLGAAFLMHSRPFEGAVLVLAVLIFLFQASALTFRFLLPAAAVLSVSVLFAGYYNFRVTGNALRLPYVLNRDTYGWPENLGFLPPKKLAPLRNAPMEAMRQRELANHAIYKDPKLFLDNLDTKFFESWVYFIGPLLTIPLLFIRHSRGSRTLMYLLAALLGLNLLQMVLYPYHLGPAVPLIFAVVTLGIQGLYAALATRSPERARAFAVVLPAALILVAAMKEFSPELRVPLTYWESAREPIREARSGIEDWLRARGGKQLVMVRYSPRHTPSQEWVYNRADIDSSDIVWARELDDNSELLNYFSSRSKWLLEADEQPQRVVPYLEVPTH